MAASGSSSSPLLPTPTATEIDAKDSEEAWLDKTRRYTATGKPAATLALLTAIVTGRTKTDLTAEAGTSTAPRRPEGLDLE